MPHEATAAASEGRGFRVSVKTHVWESPSVDPRFRGGDIVGFRALHSNAVIPAKAGIHGFSHDSSAQPGQSTSQPFPSSLSEEAAISNSPEDPLRVLVVAGGTGGHIFPALAVAEELVTRRKSYLVKGVQFQFLGTTRGLETHLIEGSGFPYRALTAAGLKGIRGWRRLKNASLLPRTFLEALGVLRTFRPDVALGLGGYVAGPVLLEAALMRIPTVLVEPNAAPGFTNRALASFVTRAAIAFQPAARYFGAKACLTGLPVRKAFFHVLPREHRSPFTILVFGGSQGSAALNRCLVGSLPLLASRPVSLIHQTGERECDEVRQAYKQAAVPAEVVAFIDNMPGAFARADLVISRAGASTAGELAAAGKAAVLVPFPGATDQHQLGNARAMERAGAARVLEQGLLTPQRVVRMIDELLASPEALTAMEQAARSMARPDAAARIADLIEGLGERRLRQRKD
jgi:UDP-N-acetylglucosamine--N-acetylmuramyl-(pentapeptide) pyrophosphoryl-undecaprenol N-acetylglucosamine transferase